MTFGLFIERIKSFTRILSLKLHGINISYTSLIYKPHKITGKGISIRNKVVIGKGCWLQTKKIDSKVNPILEIMEGSVIGNYNEIYATKQILIQKNVLTADRVYISDNSHSYISPLTPIRLQKIVQLKPVTIGEGSWIGMNVCILGAKIGRNCVIGANSVVNKDIPDYCIAVGTPAIIIKRFDFITNQWLKTDNVGNFINK